MKLLIAALVLVLVGCGQQKSKFPVNYSCMGGVGVSIGKDVVTIGAQQFKFLNEEGNIRKYKDPVENQIFSYDIVSESIMLIRYEGNQVEGILPIPDCVRKN